MANLAVLQSAVQPASQLPGKADKPLHLPLDVLAIKALFLQGLDRGNMLEISGSRSTGRASVGYAVLAAATRSGEICAVVDAYSSFCPQSAVNAGVCLSRILWIRCGGNAEHALRTVDLLLHAGGFGLIWLDLCEVPYRVLNRIPISSWYRYRKALENTATILLACFDASQVKSSFVNKLELRRKRGNEFRKGRLRRWNALEIEANAQAGGSRAGKSTLLKLEI